MNEWQVVLLEIFKILAYLLAGGFVVPAVNRIKEMLNAEKWYAFGLSVVVSAVFGVAVAFADGLISFDQFTPDNISTIFGVIFVAAQTVYQMLENHGENGEG
jgi:uncharacterized membrane protein